VERAGDLVAFHLPLGQVTAHVPAVAVQDADRTVGAAERHQFLPKALTGCGDPSPKSLVKPRQCHPRANRVGAAFASISRTSSRWLAVVIWTVLVIGCGSVLKGFNR